MFIIAKLHATSWKNSSPDDSRFRDILPSSRNNNSTGLVPILRLLAVVKAGKVWRPAFPAIFPEDVYDTWARYCVCPGSNTLAGSMVLLLLYGSTFSPIKSDKWTRIGCSVNVALQYIPRRTQPRLELCNWNVRAFGSFTIQCNFYPGIFLEFRHSRWLIWFEKMKLCLK